MHEKPYFGVIHNPLIVASVSNTGKKCDGMGFLDKVFGNRNGTGTGVSKATNSKDNENENLTNKVSGLNNNPQKRWSSLYKSEDWWAVWIGLTIFFLSLPSYKGLFILGWVPVAKPWIDISHALTSKIFDPWIGLLASFLFLAILLIPVTRFNGIKAKNWFKGFFVIFFAAWSIWILSNYAPVVKAIGSAEVGYIIALLAGILVTNVINIPSWLRSSARGELFIKIAIVLLGAKILLITFVTSAPTILTAVFLSFPVVWIIAFLLSRKMGLDRDFNSFFWCKHMWSFCINGNSCSYRGAGYLLYCNFLNHCNLFSNRDNPDAFCWGLFLSSS